MIFKQRYFLIFFLIGSLSLFLISGCGSGNWKNTNSSNTDTEAPNNTNQSISFITGTEVTVTSKAIGETGGTIETGDTGTPIDGIQVLFPAGALSSNTNISLGYNSGTLTPNEGTYAGTTFILNTGNITQFEQPVSITVPFTELEKVPVPYYVDEDGKLHLAQLVKIDFLNKTFTFHTFHTSWFTWIFINTAYAPGLDEVVDSGYIPDKDGFQIRNDGNVYNRGGECFGMTSFSLWYYMNKKSIKGDFYPKYMTVIDTDSLGKTLYGQDIIATRAFTSISQQWNTYYSNLVEEQIDLSDEVKYLNIRNAIKNNKQPVLVYLYHKDKNNGTDAHSLLAYAYNDLDGIIYVYDPNYPGEYRKIIYNRLNKVFDIYATLTLWGIELDFLASYDGIVVSGDGSLKLTEFYNNILDDADTYFEGRRNATIKITSHTNGQEVIERNITLSGNIQSGEVLVNKLKVFVGSNSFAVDIGADGYFNKEISLESGINHLQFITEGSTYETENENLKLKNITIPNNMNTTDYTINLNIPTSIMLVTLTWDKHDTDVDLYVIDPTGDYSSYYHPITSDGGELDYDITAGYGPEHWTLMSTDTIKYNQPYKLRLHYYGDHGNGATNYTVSIKLYESTNREQEYWYRGNLSVTNPGNDQPNGTGADWADIAEITLTQSQTSSAAFKAIKIDNKIIKINTTIPSKKYRAQKKM